jgi:hypothetical protein
VNIPTPVNSPFSGAEQKAATLVVDSPEQALLIETGAAPVVPDVAALMQQIDALQKRMDAMNVSAGVPRNPVEGAVKDLLAHVRAKANASPLFDFTPILDHLESMVIKDVNGKETVGDITTRDAEIARLLVDEVVVAGKHLEVGYLPELARKLHRVVLEAL